MIETTTPISKLEEGAAIIMEKISISTGKFSKFKPGEKRSGVLAKKCSTGSPIYFAGKQWNGAHVTSRVTNVYEENGVLYMETETSCYEITLTDANDPEFIKWCKY